MERRGVGVGHERVRKVSLGRTLVKQGERHLLAERPVEQRVELPLHHHEEDAHVAALADAVAEQVDTGAHLVAVATRVERRAVDGRLSARLRLLEVPLVVRNFPDENAVVAGRLLSKNAKVEVSEDGVHSADYCVD